MKQKEREINDGHVVGFCADLIDELIAHGDVCAERERLFQIIKANDYRRWQAIRDVYKTAGDHYEPYIIDWSVLFTPIESMVWGEIRYQGLPFNPQYPIGKYFADFACPSKKIVIECDGAAYHSSEQDAERDDYMISQGWIVYRISGSDCNRVVAPPWELELDAYTENGVKAYFDWMYRTADGLLMAIAHRHFGLGTRNQYVKENAMYVLSERRARGSNHA